MEKETRANKAIRDSSWKIFGYVTSIAVTLFVTPIIIFELDEHNYGVYIFIMTIIGMLGIMDLGFSTSVSKYITKYNALKDFDQIKNLVKTVNSIAFIIGTLGLIISILLGTIGHSLITGGATSEIISFYVIIGFIFFINSISLTYTNVPTSLQRFDLVTKIGTSLLIISSITNVVVVKMGYGIFGLLMTQLIFSILTLFVYRFFSKRLLPNVLSLKLAWSILEIKRIYKFGLQAFFASVGSSSSNYLNRLIIPIFLGPAALTYYSVPGGVSSRIPGITETISTTLFPLTADLASTGETERIKIVYIRSLRLITILSAAAASSLIFFNETILRYWLDETFVEKSATVFMILTITSFIMAIYGPLYNFLLGFGKLKMITTISFLMGALNAIFLFLLIPKFNIEGVALAYLISSLPIFYIVYHIDKNYLNLKSESHYYLKLVTKIIITSFFSFLIAKFILIPITTSLVILIFTGPISIVAYLGLYKIFGFYEKEDWRDLTLFGKSLINKV